MECVIVSDARNNALRELTEQSVRTSKVKCVVVEKQPIEYDCETVHYDFDFNYNKCLNLGYKHTTGNVAFCNNDLLFSDGWWEIEKYLDRYGSLSPYNPGWGFHAGFSGVVEGYNIGRELCGWCLIVSRDTMDRTGGFDEGVEFWLSDNIWSIQLQHFGIKHALVCDYHVKHLTSKTLCSGIDRKTFGRYTGGQVPLFNKAKEKYVKRDNA